MQAPVIEKLASIYLIGLRDQMTMAQQHKIPQLWQEFMPRVKEIEKKIGPDFYAIQNYKQMGNYEHPFTIWAAVESSPNCKPPKGMEGLRIPSGTYAKFLLIGMNIGGLYETIMTNWLPKSGYQIDARPHFQVMGKDYKQGSPESKEWVYVPIKKPTPQ